MRLFISLIYIFVLGYNITALILNREKCSFLEKLAFAFSLGSAFLTLIMLFLSLFNIPLQLNTILIVLTIVICVLTGWNIKKKNIVFKFCSSCKIQVDKKYILIIVFLLLIIFFEIFYVFSEALTYPIYTYDALAHWGPKSKIIFLEKDIRLDNFGITSSYPLLIPLMESWVYMNLREVNNTLVKVIFPLFFISLIISFYYAQKRYGFSKLYSLFFTVFLISNGGFFTYHSSIAYADLPFTLFYTVATLFLYFWISQPEKNKYLLISGIFSGVCLWTKVEGMYIIGINIFVMGLYCFFNREKIKKSLTALIFYFFFIGMFFLPWVIFCNIHHIDILSRIDNSVIKIGNIIPMIRTFVYLHLRPIDHFPAWGVFWLMFIITGFLNIKNNIKQPRIYLTAIIVLAGTSIVGIYLVIPEQFEIVGYITNTLNRLLLHIFPVCIFWLAIHIRKIFKS